MEESTSSGEYADAVVKSRNSSGCLVVRKKPDRIGGTGTSMHRQSIDWNIEKKRPRLIGSDSELSDERLDPYRRRVLSRVSKGYENGIGESHQPGRVMSGLNHDGFVNDGDESGRNVSRFSVNKFDAYGVIMGKKLKKRMDVRDDDGGGSSYPGPKVVPGNGITRDFETGSTNTMHQVNHSYFDRESDSVKDRFEMKRYGADEPIRVQGKNGVLKVMPNKIKKGSGLLKTYDHSKADMRHHGIVKSHELLHPFYSEQRVPNKAISSVGIEKHIGQKATVSEKKKSLDWESDTSDTALKLGTKMNLQKAPVTKNSKTLELGSDSSDTSLKLGRDSSKLKKSSTSKSNKALQWESYNGDSSLKLGPNKPESHKPAKLLPVKGEITQPTENAAVSVSNAGKIRRGSGTEKQKLREQIRKMLLDSGWTIDYRPRKNRDYQDAVYMSPSGTCYWSIIKAYEALQKQFIAEDDSLKPDLEGSLFSPISENVLSKLTRQTQKKIEKEMKRKKRQEDAASNPPEPTFSKYAKHKHDTVRNGGIMAVERSNSLAKQESLSLKDRTCERALNYSNMDSQKEINYTSEDNVKSNISNHGGKFGKLSRCTLVVSSAKKGQTLESDGYVPYTGKRTLLSWLIDSGAVRESDKVRYLNRKKTRVMQEGWITRDGIHCGCCSKILTVAKFEIHAGSKLCQPFQNIYLDSGTSLMECLMDAWNREEESKRSTLRSVYVGTDDPNDDTCGICGDGGDLICCDGCPSTFHQTCLGIQLLPPGDWHCSNCTCKFCEMTGSSRAQGNEINDCALPTCYLCERKYHQSCIQEVDVFSVDSTYPSFCGQMCKELFETLQKFIGIKHELDGGFSWSLIHRTDTDSDASLRDLTQRVECNSKLAVALTIMDECFLPIVDRRSGVNLIHNVLYNWGSKLNRVNYSGFYTAILERGDEIISTASIRFHGSQLAEMPFIGTRHIHRRQGMCRRLFRAIESALRSFKVGKMIIPAISELRHTWTEVFGFNYLEDSQKLELRSMNMLVFLGIDMLGKTLTPDEIIKPNVTTSTGKKSMERECKQLSRDDIQSEIVEDNEGDCVPYIASDSVTLASGVTLNDLSVPATALGTQVQAYVSSDKIICPNSQSVQVTKFATKSITTDDTPSKTVEDNVGECIPHVASDSATQGSGVTLNDASVSATSLDTQVQAYVFSDKIICPNSQSVQVTESATKSISTDDTPSKTVEDNEGDCIPHVASDSATQGSGVTLNDVPVPATSLDTHLKVYVSTDKITCANLQSVQVTESATKSISVCLTNASNEVIDHEDNLKADSVVDDGSKSFNDANVSNEDTNMFVSVNPVSHPVEYVFVLNKDDPHVSSLHDQEDEDGGQCNLDLACLDPCSKEGKPSDASTADYDSSGACGIQNGSLIVHNSSESASDSGITLFEVKSRSQSRENLTENVSDSTLIENKPTREVNIDDLSEDGTVDCIRPALPPS